MSCWRMKQYPPGRVAGDRINDETRTHSGSGSAVNAGQPCDRGCRRGLPRVYDDCSTRAAVSLTGHNVGDNLNAAGVSWGLLGRFRTHHQLRHQACLRPGARTAAYPIGSAVGGTGRTIAEGGTNYGTKDDYIAHHEPFQHYPSTANPHHLPPASLSAIGTDTSTAGAPQLDAAFYRAYDTDHLRLRREVIAPIRADIARLPFTVPN